MKSYLKLGAIGVCVVVAVLVMDSLELQTQRWIMLGIGLFWGFEAVLRAIEKARLDIAQRIASLERQINQKTAPWEVRQDLGTRETTTGKATPAEVRGTNDQQT